MVQIVNRQLQFAGLQLSMIRRLLVVTHTLVLTSAHSDIIPIISRACLFFLKLHAVPAKRFTDWLIRVSHQQQKRRYKTILINIETIPVVVLSMTVTTAYNETLSRSNRTLNYHDEVIYVDRHAVSTDTYSKRARNRSCVSKRKHDMRYVDITLQSL